MKKLHLVRLSFWGYTQDSVDQIVARWREEARIESEGFEFVEAD